MGLRKIRSDCEGALVGVRGLLPPALFGQYVGEVVASLHRGGPLGDHLSIASDCLLELPFSFQSVAKIHQTFGVVGLKTDRLAIMGNDLTAPAERRQSERKRTRPCRQADIAADRLCD